MSKAGKLTPAELDRAHPANVFDRLMRTDASQVVHSYRDKGKEIALTAFDLAKQEIERRRPFAFSERVKSGTGGASGTGTADDNSDGEVAKVEAHYERFSENFKKLGTKKDGLVAGFKAARKADEELTAEEFLGV